MPFMKQVFWEYFASNNGSLLVFFKHFNLLYITDRKFNHPYFSWHWIKCWLLRKVVKRDRKMSKNVVALWRSPPMVHAQKTFITQPGQPEVAAFLNCKYLLPNMSSMIPPTPPTPQICAHQKPKNWRCTPCSVYCKSLPQRIWKPAM